MFANSGRFLAALIQPIQAARLSQSISELKSGLSGNRLGKRFGVYLSYIGSLSLQQPASGDFHGMELSYGNAGRFQRDLFMPERFRR
jgi:hypothetical protein